MSRTSPDSESASNTRTLWSDGLGTVATRSIQVLAVLGLGTVLVLALLNVTVVVTPIILALIISSAIRPAVSALARRRVPTILATWIVLLGILVALSLVVWLIVWAVLNQWSELVTATENGVASLQSFVNTLPFAISGDQISQFWTWVTDFVTSSSFSSGALAGLSATATFFTAFGIFVVVLFFFLKDGPEIWEFLLRPLRGAAYDRGWRTGRQAASTFGSYVRGTTIVAAVDGLGVGIGLVILQVPLAIPLAVIVFITAYIPLVGATLAGIVAALVALVTNGPVVALVVVGIVVFVNQLEGTFLQPVVMGRSLKLHPLVVLIALTVGATLSGVLGAILAVPLTAAAWSVLQVWDGPDLPAVFARRKPVEQAEHPVADTEHPEATPAA